MRNNSATRSATFVESTLTLVFWLCASLLIMQPVHLYFTDEITQFFNFKIVSKETLFETFIIAYIFAMVVSLFISRIICHTYILCIGLSAVLIATMLLFSIPAFVSAAVFGGGLGLIPASAVCSVVEKLGISSRVRQRGKNLDRAHAQCVRPVGMYIFIPVVATLAIIVKSIFGIFFVVIFSCISIVVLLIRKKNFGFFTSKPTFKESLSGTLANGMFYLVLFMLVFISLIDVSVFYYVPHVVQDYVLHDVKNMTALVLLVMLIGRIAMIVFTELTLIHIPPRRILVLSSCAIGVAVFILSLARNDKAKIILLFVIALSLSVAFPSLIKSMAKFTSFSVLPVSVVGMALVGNSVTMVSYTYFFPYVLQTNRIMLFYSLCVVAFVFLALLFFIISRRKKLEIDDGT